MSKKVIIIGAGIAGLSAGIYAQRSGFDVTIVEQHTIPGGMCTSWKRKGYLFEGAMHWLTGSSPKTVLNELWREVSALDDGVKVRYDEPFMSVESDGKTVNLYRDLGKLEKQLIEVSPEDTAAIKRLVSYIRAFSKIGMPVTDIKGVKCARPRKMSIGAMLNMMSAMPAMGKLNKMSATEYVNTFKHPAFSMLKIVPDGFGATSLLFTLATLAAGDGGYPEGGSLAMTQRMANTFKTLGGKLRLGVKADRVVVKNGAAVGVRVNGEVLPADAVIVTQETSAATEQLFDTPPRDEWIVKLERDTKPTTCCFIGIGVRAEIAETPAFKLSEPISCGGFTYPYLALNNYTGYHGYAPEGGTALTTALMGDSYDFWKKARDEGRYEAEKQAVAEQIRCAICQKYPQAAGKIEVIDVATPLTYERYTGSTHGSWMSVVGNNNTAQCPCTLESVNSVYFAGHRTSLPGGMPSALVSGRRAAQMVCRQFNTVFR